MKEKNKKEEIGSGNEINAFKIINVQEGRDFLISRVVTRHFVSDFFQGIRSILGLRLRSYEEVIKVNYAEMLYIMRQRYGDNVKWYRTSFNPLVEDAIMINLYGELKR